MNCFIDKLQSGKWLNGVLENIHWAIVLNEGWDAIGWKLAP